MAASRACASARRLRSVVSTSMLIAPIRGAEAIAERPDGTRVWAAAYPTLLRDADGAPLGFVAISVDVTEQRRAEDAVRLLIHELNHRVKNSLQIAAATLELQAGSAADPHVRDALAEHDGQHERGGERQGNAEPFHETLRRVLVPLVRHGRERGCGRAPRGQRAHHAIGEARRGVDRPQRAAQLVFEILAHVGSSTTSFAPIIRLRSWVNDRLM